MNADRNPAQANEPLDPPRIGDAANADDPIAWANALITTRRHVSPKRLIAPGPTEQQLQELLTLAAAAPDHGRLTPWRFIVIPTGKRHQLAETFALALTDRDPTATPEQVEMAREKAFRAPLLMVAVACLGPREPDIPPLERMISMGAAIQNVLLGAHAMGFGGGLTGGQAMSSSRLRALLLLAETERPVCCVNIGTVATSKPGAPIRPAPESFTTVL